MTKCEQVVIALTEAGYIVVAWDPRYGGDWVVIDVGERGVGLRALTTTMEKINVRAEVGWHKNPFRIVIYF